MIDQKKSGLESNSQQQKKHVNQVSMLRGDAYSQQKRPAEKNPGKMQESDNPIAKKEKKKKKQMYTSESVAGRENRPASGCRDLDNKPGEKNRK
jgi:hypothetical protein